MSHSPRRDPIRDGLDANVPSTKPASFSPIAAIFLAVGFFAPAATVAQQPASSLNSIKQDQPGFYVRASCDHATRIYEEGDAMKLTVKCEVDAYLYAVYEQADGKKYQIFPNSGQRDNRVTGGKEIQIPGDKDLFRWSITPPFGKEKVFVIASKKPLESLPRLDQATKSFNPISDAQVKGAALELGKQEGKTWTEHSIEITTMPRQAKPLHTGGRRFGLFAGVNDYKFGLDPKKFEKLGLDPKDYEKFGLKSLNFAVPDTQKMQKTFTDFGSIPTENSFFLQDKDVTKAAMKDYITKKLPSMTQPGDTVFIYFSGHGGPTLDELPDEPGHDEPDMWDEVLCTWDYFGWDTYLELRKLQSEGKLPSELVELVRQVGEKNQREFDKCAAIIDEAKQKLELLKDRPDDDPEKKTYRARQAVFTARRDSLVCKETGISDDEFGHWLQALDGRQVIVILDNCHSGGFDENAKREVAKGLGATEVNKAFHFNFMGGAMDRLKDIGQRDTALMAAAPAGLPSIESGRIGGSIFGQHLMKIIRESRSTLTFESAFEQVKTGMAQWFVENLDKMPPNFKEHQPTMANYCSKMPIMKP